MIYKLIGYKTYEGDYEGKKYYGTRLFMTYVDPSIDGEGCEAIKVKNSFLTGLKIGNLHEVKYDKYGNVVDVVPVKV